MSYSESDYANRELSWLDFNERVLSLAQDESLPLLERLKFAAIWSTNLDEFFMVRVAGLHDQIEARVDARGPDGLSPTDILALIRTRVAEALPRHTELVRDRLFPELAEHGYELLRIEDCDRRQSRAVQDRFEAEVLPILTPLAAGWGRKFPYISNLSLSLGALVRDPRSDETIFARVKVPREATPRFLAIEGSKSMVLLEDVLAKNIGLLFPGMEVLASAPFRVTRDADFNISDEADDLLSAVEAELRQRRFGEVVRLEISADAPEEMHELLLANLELAADDAEADTFTIDGFLGMGDLWELVKRIPDRELCAPAWTPAIPGAFQAANDDRDIFSVLRERDVLVHHPYDSFAGSVEAFITAAQRDPEVLAIKQTVYRTSDDSNLVPSLIAATEDGKQAVCVVEVKARFDEQANIHWARALEQAGVHVVHGLPGLKTHAKTVLVARREGAGVRLYAHVGTGNYHAHTARVYEDFGLFTADRAITSDVARLFNYLTGFARPEQFEEVLVAPLTMRKRLLEEIDLTIAYAQEHGDARIMMKMNSLVDQECIDKLYAASQGGVKVDLLIRGICCLRPGVKGLSDNITVVSVVGRLLEHARAYAFCRGEEVYCLIGSADLMPRNLDSRVELLTPIKSAPLRDEVCDSIEKGLADNANCWELHADGMWRRRSDAIERRDSQAQLASLAAERTREMDAYG